jgi:glycerophosphoryl diester phosphodiesterase
MINTILKISFLFTLTYFFLSCSKKNSGSTEPTIVLKATFTVSLSETMVNSQITFTGSSTDDESNIVSWLWDFADGSPSITTKNATHQYPLAGSYLVKLSIRNKAGQTAIYSKRVLIKNILAPNYGSLLGLKEKLALLKPKTMVAAHRAYHENFPENSIEAINDANLNQINIVELDARFTLDNELILMHDATTTRTTNGSYTVAQKTLSELKQLRLLFNGIPTAYTIPTLKESLEAAKGKVYVNIDASWDNSVTYYNKIYNTVAALNMVNMVMIYTESADVAKGLLELDRDVIVLLGAGNSTDYSNALNMNPKAALWHLANATLSPNFTTWPSNNGIKLWANAYVNSTNAPPLTGPDTIVDNLTNNAVSLIQTDYPVRVKNYLLAKNLWLH